MKLGFSGMGNMASAILHIVLAKNLFTPEDIFVFDKQIEKMDACKSRGVSVCKSNVEVIDAADILILAVKPQYIEDVLGEISSRSEGKCIVSIAAGITSDYLKAKLSPLAHVVRIMPNTPLMVSEGATAIAASSEVPAEMFDTVLDIFGSAGEIAVLDEALLNPVIGVNASSPAFFFRMIKAMVNSAVSMGVPEETALSLAAKTMMGSAKMLLSTKKTPDELISQVTSEGGTTYAALTAFDQLGFDELIEEAMRRCTKRAYELSK